MKNYTLIPGRVYQFTYQRIIRLIADISGYGQGEKWPFFVYLVHMCAAEGFQPQTAVPLQRH